MPGLIDTAADLIDVSGNAADGSSQFLLLGAIHFDGTTAQWQKLYRALSEEQKKELMIFVSHTVSELRILPCPEQFKKILPFYLIKYNGKTEQLSDDAVQLSFMDDSDVVIEEE